MIDLLPFALVLVVLALPTLYVIAQYNQLIALRNHIRDSGANIDTELRRRHDLIPNLVATVKGYAAHEKSILESVVALRAQCVAGSARSASGMDAESQLGRAVGNLLAIAEQYPALKADQHFLELQHELAQTEDRIQAARRFYNGNIRDYRNKRESFPSNLVANLLGFGPELFFEIEPQAREAPRIA